MRFQGNGTTLLGYQARPRSATGALPLILVCHENRGVTEHIKDVARRFAKEGYLAFALDLLSRQGGTANVPQDQMNRLIFGDDQLTVRHANDFKAAIDYYKTQPQLADTGKVGMTGFCGGGSVVWRTVELVPDVKGAAPFYGGAPPLEEVKNIKAAVLGVYSSDPNDFANRGRDELDQALTAAGVTHEFKVYPNTGHAFHNDTGSTYNQEQAIAAWRDMIAWFQRYVKA